MIVTISSPEMSPTMSRLVPKPGMSDIGPVSNTGLWTSLLFATRHSGVAIADGDGDGVADGNTGPSVVLRTRRLVVPPLFAVASTAPDGVPPAVVGCPTQATAEPMLADPASPTALTVA